MDDDASTSRARTAMSTTIFGRKCHIPEINSKNPAERAFAERAGDQRADPGLGRRHHPPRHGAHAGGARRPRALDAKMLLQVHDELVFEAPEEARSR